MSVTDPSMVVIMSCLVHVNLQRENWDRTESKKLESETECSWLQHAIELRRASSPHLVELYKADATRQLKCLELLLIAFE
jgi:hypothetical protein